MDKSQIQKRTKELLERVGTPKEFTKGLEELLKSNVDKEATKNYQRIIPDTGKFFGVPLPILRVVAAEIGKFIQKEPTRAQLLLETTWNEGYFESENEYPVLYLLDGAEHFHHDSGIVQFLSTNGLMPQTIVVAIPNIARMRDFTPTVEKGRVNAGGVDNFLNFMQNELIPVVDTKYRTQQYRILFGHSLTGMFSVYTFATRPALFNAYIAANPYLQYDEGIVIKKANELLTKKSVDKKILYLTLGDEPDYVESIDKFTSILKEIDTPGLEWKYVTMKQENHASIPHKTIYEGLEFVFSGWQIPADKANDLASILNHYSSLSEKFGFTVHPPEFLLNQLGYQLMGNEEYIKSIEAFQTNVKIYPNSDNVYDSLGDAYEKSGDLKLATKNYGIAVEKGEKVKSQNLAVYKANLERVQALLK